jgi:hypothetical protein
MAFHDQDSDAYLIEHLETCPKSIAECRTCSDQFELVPFTLEPAG